MCVVTHAALFEDGGLVSMDLRKIITLMTVETAAFESKTAAPVQTVTLRALHTRNRRMLMKGLKGGWRIRTDKEMRFFFAAVPQENQRVQARGCFQCGVKHIWKGLLGLNREAVQLEFSRRRGRNQIDLSALMR